MLIRRKRGWELPERAATPEHVYLDRRRLLRALGIGGAILAVGMYLLSTMGPDVSYLRVMLYMVVVGLGVGPSLPLYTLAIQNAVDVRKVGQATSASQFFRQIGGTVGVAIMGTILASTLAAAFVGIGGPEGAAFSARGLTGELGGELRSGADPATLVGAAFDTQYALIAAAIESGDPERLTAALAASPIPAEARSFIVTGAANARGDAAATGALLARLQAQFDAQADEVTTTVVTALKTGTTDAINTIYRALVFVVLIGMAFTTLIPALELRTTNDVVVAAAAEA
jgi:hypothetical protein